MPCYQMNLVSVEFKAKSKPHLEAALVALGWSYSYFANDMKVRVKGMTLDLETGKAEISQYGQDTLNKLKIAYSVEVVKSEAAKRRWVLKKRAAQKFEARRY
jgi:hypothetical protein